MTQPAQVDKVAQLQQFVRLGALNETQHKSIKQVGKWAQRRLPQFPSKPSSSSFSSLSLLASPDAEIDNLQQFYKWYDTIEAQMELHEGCDRSQDALDLLALFKGYEECCHSLQQDLEGSFKALEFLESQYSSVSEKTGQLHNACETLLQQQTLLKKVTESVSSKLKVFSELETISARLQGSVMAVSDENFFGLLQRLDECIDFMAQNPSFLDSASYLQKFRSLQNQALTLVRNYVTQSIKTTTQQVISNAPKLQSVSTDPDNVDISALYLPFRTLSPKLRPLCQEIQNRSSISPEFSNLLVDCQICLLQHRKHIMAPIINQALSQIVTNQNLSLAIRSGSLYIIRVCELEYHLFVGFFGGYSAHLRAMQETLGEQLYQFLRPMFIHTRDIDALCSAFQILSAEVLQDYLVRKGEASQAFQGIVYRMIADVQQRLSFMAEIFVAEEISLFSPSDADLSYPDKLTSSNKTETLYSTWYPTLERTLMCLSKLYRCLDSTIFESIAREMISECLESLFRASAEITKRKKPVDAQLFLVYHLLILREQISPFDISMTIEKKVDFTSTLATAVKGWMALLKWRTDTSSVRQFLMTQPFTESEVDCKKVLDKALLSSIEIYLSHSASSFFDPVKSLTTAMSAFANTSSPPSSSLSSPGSNSSGSGPNSTSSSSSSSANSTSSVLKAQKFAGPQAIHDVLANSFKSMEQTLPEIVSQLRVYLWRPAHLNLILVHLKELLLGQYGTLMGIIEQHYDAEEKAVIHFASLGDIRQTVEQLLQRIIRQSEGPSPSVSPSSSSSDLSSVV